MDDMGLVTSQGCSHSKQSDLKGCRCCPSLGSTDIILKGLKSSLAFEFTRARLAWDVRGMSSRLDTFAVAVQNSTHHTVWTLSAVCVYWGRPLTLNSALWSRIKVPRNVNTRCCGKGKAECMPPFCCDIPQE